jgi:hypothetical protein
MNDFIFIVFCSYFRRCFYFSRKRHRNRERGGTEVNARTGGGGCSCSVDCRTSGVRSAKRAGNVVSGRKFVRNAGHTCIHCPRHTVGLCLCFTPQRGCFVVKRGFSWACNVSVSSDLRTQAYTHTYAHTCVSGHRLY